MEGAGRGIRRRGASYHTFERASALRCLACRRELWGTSHPLPLDQGAFAALVPTGWRAAFSRSVSHAPLAGATSARPVHAAHLRAHMASAPSLDQDIPRPFMRAAMRALVDSAVPMEAARAPMAAALRRA